MVKKFLIFFLSLLVFILIIYTFKNLSKEIKERDEKIIPSLSPIENNTKPLTEINNKFLFVPYWSFDENVDDQYDNYIYFGVNVNEKGIEKNNENYKKANEFAASIDKNKFLTLIMTNFDINSMVLKDRSLQKKIIEDSVDIAVKNSFNGIVLDFEITGLPFDSLISSISNFYSGSYKIVKAKNLQFYVTIYGDVFYRARPYDVKTIAANSDAVLIMAYDFHKAKGNSGPNFPFEGKQIYGYDFKNMIVDFMEIIPREKIIVIFGLYGYDWVVDEKNQSKTQAKSLSFNEIKNKFLDECNFDKCLVEKDNVSKETKITYQDTDLENHIVWFEDINSVNKKIEFLKQKGISQIGYWAYSYF